MCQEDCRADLPEKTQLEHILLSQKLSPVECYMSVVLPVLACQGPDSYVGHCLGTPCQICGTYMHASVRFCCPVKCSRNVHVLLPRGRAVHPEVGC